MGAIAEGFASFARPLIDQTDGSPEQLNKAFAIAQLCYNLAILPEEKRDKSLSEMQHALAMDDEELESLRHSIVLPMIRRHEEMFPLMHQRVSTVACQNDPWQQMHPTMGDSLRKSTTTDRYAPCPCNSGKKYKFCCGKKPR